MQRFRLRRATLAVVALTVLASISVMPSSAVAERTIGLSAGLIEFNLAPGQSAGDSINVANHGDEPVKVLLYTADILADEEGNQQYERPDPNVPTSPATWVRLKAPDDTKVFANTPYLEMDPGEEFTVEYTVVVPPNTPSGDHNAIIFFEMFDFADDLEQTQSLVSGRLGSRLAIRVVGEINDRLDLTSLTARGLVIGTQMPFGVRVDNSGSNVDKTYSLDLQLVGSGENEVWSEELEADGRVYAGKERDYSGVAELSGVGVGRYVARAVLSSTQESGVDSITVEPLDLDVERTVWVVPLWLAIVLVLVIGFPLLYASWRLSRRQSGRSGRRGATRHAPRDDMSYDGQGRRRGAGDTDDYISPGAESRRGDSDVTRRDTRGTAADDNWADDVLDDPPR